MTLNSLGLGWRLIASLIVDILNPLFLISLALFSGVGYILTLLMPVAIGHWQTLFWLTLLAPFVFLARNARVKWKRNEYRDPTWRVLLPIVPLLVVTPAVWAEFTSPTLQVMHHGDIHIRLHTPASFRNHADRQCIHGRFSGKLLLALPCLSCDNR